MIYHNYSLLYPLTRAVKYIFNEENICHNYGPLDFTLCCHLRNRTYSGSRSY